MTTWFCHVEKHAAHTHTHTCEEEKGGGWGGRLLAENSFFFSKGSKELGIGKSKPCLNLTVLVTLVGWPYFPLERKGPATIDPVGGTGLGEWGAVHSGIRYFFLFSVGCLFHVQVLDDDACVPCRPACLRR